MEIGIPKEIRALEGRIALTPKDCAPLVAAGHTVRVQHGAGLASGYADADYEAEGCRISPDAASVYAGSQLIVKVKEPQKQEIPLLHEDHLLFCYLHLAAYPHLTQELLACGVTGIGFEIVDTDGALPLLAPMSHVAGRLSAQIGAQLLHGYNGGRGVLLGGVDNTEPGQALVLGAGQAGSAAVGDLVALGARVAVMNRTRPKLEALQAKYPDIEIFTPDQIGDQIGSQAGRLDEFLAQTDLLVGAVLAPGRAAPIVVSEAQVQTMRPGSVIIDIAIDQGGCIATSEPTDYTDPVRVKHGVLHFGVTNMPGAVPRTSAQALSAAIAPYVLRLADGRLHDDPQLEGAIYLEHGRICYPGLS